MAARLFYNSSCSDILLNDLLIEVRNYVSLVLESPSRRNSGLDVSFIVSTLFSFSIDELRIWSSSDMDKFDFDRYMPPSLLDVKGTSSTAGGGGGAVCLLITGTSFTSFLPAMTGGLSDVGIGFIATVAGFYAIFGFTIVGAPTLTDCTPVDAMVLCSRSSSAFVFPALASSFAATGTAFMIVAAGYLRLASGTAYVLPNASKTPLLL